MKIFILSTLIIGAFSLDCVVRQTAISGGYKVTTENGGPKCSAAKWCRKITVISSDAAGTTTVAISSDCASETDASFCDSNASDKCWEATQDGSKTSICCCSKDSCNDTPHKVGVNPFDESSLSDDYVLPKSTGPNPPPLPKSKGGPVIDDGSEVDPDEYGELPGGSFPPPGTDDSEIFGSNDTSSAKSSSGASSGSGSLTCVVKQVAISGGKEVVAQTNGPTCQTAKWCRTVTAISLDEDGEAISTGIVSACSSDASEDEFCDSNAKDKCFESNGATAKSSICCCSTSKCNDNKYEVGIRDAETSGSGVIVGGPVVPPSSNRTSSNTSSAKSTSGASSGSGGLTCVVKQVAISGGKEVVAQTNGPTCQTAKWCRTVTAISLDEDGEAISTGIVLACSSDASEDEFCDSNANDKCFESNSAQSKASICCCSTSKCNDNKYQVGVRDAETSGSGVIVGGPVAPPSSNRTTTHSPDEVDPDEVEHVEGDNSTESSGGAAATTASSRGGQTTAAVSGGQATTAGGARATTAGVTSANVQGTTATPKASATTAAAVSGGQVTTEKSDSHTTGASATPPGLDGNTVLKPVTCINKQVSIRDGKEVVVSEGGPTCESQDWCRTVSAITLDDQGKAIATSIVATCPTDEIDSEQCSTNANNKCWNHVNGNLNSTICCCNSAKCNDVPYEVGIRDVAQGGSQGGGDTNIVQINTGSLSAQPETSTKGSSMISASIVMVFVPIVLNVRL